ncbi:MAG TPA: IS66 family transposase, partial [Ktedonobacterales bacterium]
SACHRWHEAPLDLSHEALGQGRMGVRLAALIAHLRTALRLPVRTIVRYLADLHGLHISVGAVVDLLHRMAARGAPTVEQFMEQARQRAVVHADETGWSENGHNGYVWLLATPQGERVYTFDRSRSGQVINGLLGEAFRGVLITDFYGAYNDTPGGKHQRCWVHLLRDVHALGEAYPLPTSLLALEVRSWTQAVIALWQRVHAAATSPPDSTLLRERAAHELLDELQALGVQFVEQMGHPCRPLAWRVWHFAHELLTCVRQPGVVPCDNNAAERALRPLVIARKISGGSRSPRGSATRVTLCSLFATWTAQGHDPLLHCQQLLQGSLPQL